MWIKVDDSFVSHPKVLRGAEMLGDFGFGRLIGAWLVGQSYACKHQTDGLLPKRIVQRFDDPDITALLTALLTCGLWEACDDGYRIHDFHDYNPKAERVKAARKANLKRQQEYLAKRYARKALSPPDPTTPPIIDGVNNGVTNGVNDAIPGTRYPVPVLSPSTDVDGSAWEDWREAWQVAGFRQLPLACKKIDEEKFVECGRRFPDQAWRRLLLKGFFSTANEEIRAKPPSIGWFLYWADWIDEQYRKAGKRPNREAAA